MCDARAHERQLERGFVGDDVAYIARGTPHELRIFDTTDALSDERHEPMVAHRQLRVDTELSALKGRSGPAASVEQTRIVA
ncbi:MAG TPA: hypothetical protein VM282_24600 [Acidimicrobiales bacterium]|nr:hypothetical protein [Acidimicrobiales bacterium]